MWSLEQVYTFCIIIKWCSPWFLVLTPSFSVCITYSCAIYSHDIWDEVFVKYSCTLPFSSLGGVPIYSKWVKTVYIKLLSECISGSYTPSQLRPRCLVECLCMRGVCYVITGRICRCLRYWFFYDLILYWCWSLEKYRNTTVKISRHRKGWNKEMVSIVLWRNHLTQGTYWFGKQCIHLSYFQHMKCRLLQGPYSRQFVGVFVVHPKNIMHIKCMHSSITESKNCQKGKTLWNVTQDHSNAHVAAHASSK